MLPHTQCSCVFHPSATDTSLQHNSSPCACGVIVPSPICSVSRMHANPAKSYMAWYNPLSYPLGRCQAPLILLISSSLQTLAYAPHANALVCVGKPFSDLAERS